VTYPVDLASWDLSDFDPARIPAYLPILSPDEIARADRYAHQKDRVLYITAHYLLRQTLSLHAPIKPSDWRFLSGPHGKPALLDNDSALAFNLTHTNGLVAVAVSRGTDLGIDAECSHRRVNTHIADHRFSDAEITWLKALSPDEQVRGFLRLWTLKEAFLKSTGKGLTQSLSSFTIQFDPLSIAMKQVEPDWPATFQLFELRPTPIHFLALALPQKGTPRAINWRAYRPD
jgi:4'-phosphopantetheinyl transferase